MSAENSKSDGPAFSDKLGQRLRWAVLASLLINLGIWRGAAAIAHRATHVVPRPVEITRVILDKKGHKTPKVVTKKQIQKKVAHIRKIVRRPPPRPRAVVHVYHRPHPVPAPKPARVAHRPPPQGAHHRVLIAKGNTPAAPNEPTVQPGGNAELGKPIEHQNPGNAVVNPPTPVEQKPVPPAPPPPPPPPPPPVKVAKTPPAPAPEPEPEPAPPPKPRGPTRDAEPADQVKPEIPDDLKQSEYKSFVRVKVEVDPDGSATPILRTSSGNPEIDRRVLTALRRWRWKPALRDGEPVRSTLLFKFEFEVN